MSLVLLRLAVGWHFFMQGLEKYTDPNFSSAGFLMQAKGPLAEFYHSKVPQVHGWRTLLAIPPDSDLSDAARADAVREWQAEYDQRRADAREAEQPEPFEVSPHEPYTAWATQIAQDWKATLDRFVQLPDLSDEHKDQARAALDARRQELLEYLQGIGTEIVEFRLELARVRDLSKRTEADEVPYYEDRIQSLQSEAMRTPQPWLADVAAIESAYVDDLRDIYHTAAEAQAADVSVADSAGDAEEGAGSENEDAPESSGAPQSAGAPQGAGAPQETANDGAASDVEEDAETDSASREGLPPEPAEAAPAGEVNAAAGEPDADTNQDDTDQNGAGTDAQSGEGEPSTGDGDAANGDAANGDAANGDAANGDSGDGDSGDGDSGDGDSGDGDSGDGDSGDGAATDADEEVITLSEVFIDDQSAQLALVDKIVTWLTLGVGACLVVGLFVPVAGFAGAVFLAAVISTQPPLVPGAQETYYQFIEMFSLLVLACTCAGRWAGLDYFFALLFSRGGRSQP